MQSIYLLDTNIVSEITKLKPEQKVLNRIYKARNISCISSVGFDEMLYGVKKLPSCKKKDDLFSFCVDFIQSNFEIVPFDLDRKSVV